MSNLQSAVYDFGAKGWTFDVMRKITTRSILDVVFLNRMYYSYQGFLCMIGLSNVFGRCLYNVKSLLTLVTLFHINLLLELGHNMF